MSRGPLLTLRGWTRFSSLCLGLTLALGVSQRLHAEIDASVNQAVWKMYFGVTDTQLASPAWLAADDDGDGLKNGDELAAGTNPFNAKSNLAASATLSADAATTVISIPTAWGKLYRLQSTADLSSPASWTDVSPVNQISGDGTAKTLSVTPPGPTVFYRVMAMDQDTDGDGLSDWAEKITGFDPNNAHTHGAAADDHTALLADLSTENIVNVTADKPSATQPPDALTAATDTGTLTITRGGSLHFAPITVPLQWSGTAVAGTDYAMLPATVTFPVKVSSVTLTVVPLVNAARRNAVTVTLAAQPGGGYTIGSGAASVLISPSGNATGTGLTAYYWNSTSALVGTYSANLFAANPVLTRLENGVNFTYTVATSPGTGVNTTNFVARWVGQVQPQYSETYYFDTSTDDGVKLWVNGQPLIDGWKYQSADRIAAIALQAGVLYDIKMEYFQGTGAEKAILYWYSDSQVKQVIPTTRLYPATTTVAPPAIVGGGTAYGFVGQPFTYALGASASGGTALTFARSANSGPLPPGLTLNATTGVVSGTPTQAGGYQAAFTVVNAAGTGAGVVSFQILNPGSGVTRELWTGLAGSGLTDVPLSSAPGSIDNDLLTPEDNVAYGNNTGERLRGYFVAPATGNYYFWLAASNAAELWISDDEEPVNLLRRASVVAPGTTSRNWTDSAQTNQRTPWLSLVAGQSYYYEILHNTGGAGASSNVAMGYLLDANGTATTPVVTSGNTGGGTTTASTGVVPAYLSSRYSYPTASAQQGALYVTNLSPQGTAVSAATGSANLRVLPGNTQAVLHFSYSGLSSPRTAYHIHIAPDNTGSGPIIFDLDDVDKFHPDLIGPDGGYLWNITDVGAYTAAQVVAAIQQGRTYFNVHTVNYPNGEIRGFLNLVNGSQNAPTAVADSGYTNDSAADAGAARFLNQAAWGAAPADLAAVKTSGYSAWLDSQMALPATHLLPDVQAQIAAQINTNLGGNLFDNAWWRAAMLGSDQLRQRVAFALSEVLVISDSNSTISGRPDTMASYYDMLADNAFGNFRELLEAATLHPAMGYWLNMQGSQKGNLATGYHPNENYGREIMQLFSVGLNRMWPDGSFVLDSTGNLVPTYNQGTITNGFARVFTGWTWHQALQTSGQLPTGFGPSTNWIDPMTMVKNYHELGAKYLLNNVVLPPAVGYSLAADAVAGSQADTKTVAYDNYCLNDLERGLDNIANHPNVGPYICRQLIQRLVESNPSPGYLGRVVAKFNDDGSAAHVRGNLAAVVRSILLDGEARNAGLAAVSTTSGKQREPLLRITGPGRTFLFGTNSGSYSQNGTAIMTITTASPHKFSASDVVFLDFSVNNSGTPPVAPANNPTSGAYTVLSNPAPTSTTFAVTAATLSNVTTASQAANGTILNVPTSGPPAGEKVYLKFLTSGFADGVYTVIASPGSSFTVDVGGTAPTAAVTGIALIVPKGSGYDNLTKGTKDANGNVTTPSTVSIATNSNFNLNVGDNVWIVAGTANQLKDAQWTVASVTDERHFTVTNTAAYTAESNIGITIYPLVAPVLSRSGNAGLPASKFDMGNTNGQLVQTPMDAVTVFNFFYPDYQFPGTLSANNITTPEFQLTTDTNVVTLSNTINSTILTSGNVNGLSNFKSGALNLDLSAYMGSPYVSVSTQSTTSGTKVTAVTTTTVDATALVNKLGDVLTGGMMTQAAKDKIAAFLNNTTYFPPTVTVTGTTTAPPTAPTLPTTSARDKVRAVVQQIIVSSEYAVQR